MEVFNIGNQQTLYKIIQNYCRDFNNFSVWNEVDYRIDVCRLTKGANIENL